MNLLAAVKHFCTQNKKVWVAYSGGLDSQVLLHLCLQIRMQHKFEFHAIHVHHGLSLHADQWVEHCQQFCEQNNIPIHLKYVVVDIERASQENAARVARYQAFVEMIAPQDILLTAHHQDDQAETLLLQLFRGAGVKGLAAMPICKQQNYLHARPLLSFSRKNLKDYAEQHNLQWIDDESNSNTKFSRNYLRQEIIPALLNHWPSVQRNISRSAEHCAEAQELLDEFSADLCLQMQGSEINTLSVSKLLNLNPAKQRLVLRSWIYTNGFSLPSRVKLETILKNVLTARWDRVPCVDWEGVEIRRHRDDLYIQAPLTAHDNQIELLWDFNEIDLPGIGKLQRELVKGAGLIPDIKHVTLRYRRGGEVAYLKNKHHDLKKLLQEWNVLPWQRDRIPLLYHDEKLISVVGYYIHADYKVKNEEIGNKVIVRSLEKRDTVARHPGSC